MSVSNQLINRTKEAGGLPEDFSGTRSCSSSPVITSLVVRNQMTKAKYTLRVFFDAGSGVLLWSGNSAARERFDYPVNHYDLPLL